MKYHVYGWVQAHTIVCAESESEARLVAFRRRRTTVGPVHVESYWVIDDTLDGVEVDIVVPIPGPEDWPRKERRKGYRPR